MRLFQLSRPLLALMLLIYTAGSESFSQTPYRYPKHEARAVWLTTIGGLDWPHTYSQTEATAKKQKRELCSILDRLQAANVNIVMLQTRIRGTVIYPSAIEPWDACLSGKPGASPGYDALQFAIDECHKRGMELHAWLVTIPVGKWGGMGCRRLKARHPRMVRKIGNEGFLDPGNAQTGDYLAEICKEITANYDVDGIHLDYIRYPETWENRPKADNGRANITSIVRKIHAAVKTLKPWVKVSCSPIGKHGDLARYGSNGWNAYHKGSQDAQGWLSEGIMDALFPMMYFRGNQFYPFAFDWKENANGRIMSIGLGIYFLSDKEKDWPIEAVTREMNVLRRHGMGHAYFRSKFFTDNVKGIYDFAKDFIDRHPALVPPMTWQSAAVPQEPKELCVSRMAAADQLAWCGAVDRSNGPYLTYNIYASESYPVDTSNPQNIIATRLRDTSIIVALANNGKYMNYAVTATDRYGNESKAISTPPQPGDIASGEYLHNDGQRLMLPAKGQVLDADYIAIETLQGGLIGTRPYKGSHVDISTLRDGFYVLKSLNGKGITHRLGLFAIRRKAESQRP